MGKRRSRVRPFLRWMLYPVLFAATGALGLAAWGTVRFGSYAAAKAYLQGSALFVDLPTQSLGEIPAQRKTTVRYRLRNLKSRAVTIVGAETSCGCAQVDHLPLAIGPRERRELSFVVMPSLKDVGKPFQQQAELYLEIPAPRVVLGIRATVRDAQQTLSRRKGETTF